MPISIHSIPLPAGSPSPSHLGDLEVDEQQIVPSGVTLGRQQQVQPRPRHVVVLQRGQHQRQVAHVLQVLLLAALVRHPHRHFGDLDVDEQLVLFRSLLYDDGNVILKSSRCQNLCILRMFTDAGYTLVHKCARKRKCTLYFSNRREKPQAHTTAEI